MKKLTTIALIAGSLLMTQSAFAYGDRNGNWLISGGTAANFRTNLSGAGTTGTITAAGGIGHTLGSMFELMAFAVYDNSLVPTTTDVGAQLNLSFGDNHKSAFYLGGYYNFIGTTGYGAAVGKRFLIGGSVAYDPEATVDFSSTALPLTIYPIRFTLVF